MSFAERRFDLSRDLGFDEFFALASHTNNCINLGHLLHTTAPAATTEFSPMSLRPGKTMVSTDPRNISLARWRFGKHSYLGSFDPKDGSSDDTSPVVPSGTSDPRWVIPPRSKKEPIALMKPSFPIFCELPDIGGKGRDEVTDSCNSWPVIWLRDLLPRRSCLRKLSWEPITRISWTRNWLRPKARHDLLE